ncbi:MAG: Sua5/YciO/YrdC/YwlC family protein [bacterium]|nr:Sua5/YciO/YrdC/YwlC family protein [bacterium]
MKSSVIRVNPKKPEKFIIERAAKIIKKGGLVAFSTETVYGLGVNTLDKKKVKVILAESFSERGIGFDIMHRLRKAATNIKY